ncbi:UNVERIFIED_CONTAM: hypothetical protein RMT77_004906 [Armadillidium vulgare]
MPALCLEPIIPEPPTVSCVSTVPILKKMKVLKRFKKKMGLASRPETSSLPPLLFHPVCGDNVRIEGNGRIARRVESFCKGISFSNRSVKVGEKVFVKLIEISTNWSGIIRFGFTSEDPAGLKDSLPKYACPDLTSKPGYWAKALSERFAVEGLVLFYYVTSAGDVHFGINNEERGVFFSGVETKTPLWSIIDVYGNSTGIEYLDPLAMLNNRVRIVNDLRPCSNTFQSHIISTQDPPRPTTNSCRSSVDVENLQPSLAQLALTSGMPRYYSSSLFIQFPFHRVKGRHVLFNEDRTIVSRVESEYSHGYVFTSRPLRSGENFVIKVQETEPMYVGALAFGLTAANPAGLDSADLPEDCDLLLDRPEYWVVSKDVASSPVLGDELAFGLTSDGKVTLSKNGGPPQTVMHVDNTLQLWAFFDVYGNTKKIKMLGSISDSSNANSVPRQSSPQHPRNITTENYLSIRRNEPLPGRHSQTVGISDLPTTPPREILRVRECVTQPKESQIHVVNQTGREFYSHIMQFNPVSTLNQHECTVCYEKAVDSVLYVCGHMCMCYECALQQWRGRGGGLCPICRAPIRDVIRTYRS